MINCAHPQHFLSVLQQAKREGAGWLRRLGGLRANSSCKSHQELDEATELDAGDPQQLGLDYKELVAQQLLAAPGVLGGCCGTDERHLASICKAVFGSSAAD